MITRDYMRISDECKVVGRLINLFILLRSLAPNPEGRHCETIIRA